jgi:hypothetical protein
MNAIALIGLLASVASLILAVIAIWLSLYFYSKSKDTETEVRVVLGQIKQQTESLERLSARQLMRLTRAVTEPRPLVDDSLHALLRLRLRLRMRWSTTSRRPTSEHSTSLG